MEVRLRKEQYYNTDRSRISPHLFFWKHFPTAPSQKAVPKQCEYDIALEFNSY